MIGNIKHLPSSQRGATAIEYALLAALIAVAVVGSVTMLGLDVRGAYAYVAGCVANLGCP